MSNFSQNNKPGSAKPAANSAIARPAFGQQSGIAPRPALGVPASIAPIAEPIKAVPSDIIAEQAVLGALMIADTTKSSAMDEVMAMITPGDFYRAANGEIFDVMIHLHEQGKPMDMVDIRNELRRRGTIEAVGNIGYLMSLMDFIPTDANVLYHAEIVAQKSLTRRLIEAGSRISGMGYADELTAKEQAEQAEREVSAAIQDSPALRTGKGWLDMKSLITDLRDEVEERYHSPEDVGMIGIPTGFSEIDEVFGAYQPGEFIVLGARPSMGKTAESGTEAISIAKAGNVVAYFSAEMQAKQLMYRFASAESKVNSRAYLRGKVTDDEYERFEKAMRSLWDLPLYIDETTDICMSDIRAKCRKLQRQVGQIGVVYIDYLQLLAPDRADRNADVRIQVGNASKQCKALAKELGCTVVALAQLSRSVERREDKRPILSDLKESGDIEANADRIVFLYRPDYYAPKGDVDDTEVSKTEYIMAKHRNGPVGKIDLGLIKAYCQFVPFLDRETPF